MSRGLMGSFLVLALAASSAAAQQPNSALGNSTAATAAPRTNLIVNQASPSDSLSSQAVSNPRMVSNEPTLEQLKAARMAMEEQFRLDEYQRQHEARLRTQARAQAEREMRQMRMEIRKFYGISSARPVDPTGMGVFYHPVPMTWSSYRYPTHIQQLHFQIR